MMIKRLLALAGIGGFYLHTARIRPGTEERHCVTIKGPYRTPVNPYAGHHTHFFEAEVRFHLNPPVGIETPDGKAAR